MSDTVELENSKRLTLYFIYDYTYESSISDWKTSGIIKFLL